MNSPIFLWLFALNALNTLDVYAVYVAGDLGSVAVVFIGLRRPNET